MAKHKTPMLDELTKGPWPSWVDDIKGEAERRKANPDNIEFQVPADVCDDWLGLQELSYKDKETHWKHGGIVGVFGYGGGVIGRYCDMPQQFPGVAHFHTVRVNQPSGKYYTTEFLRGLCDIWDLRGSGMTNMHGSTGDIVLLGTFTEQLEEIFFELTHNMNTELGGSGSNLRTPAGCLGKSRCEFACYDTMALEYSMVQQYQDELHRPAFPYKFKFKFDGCPMGCVCSIARSDFSVIGTWKSDIRIDQGAVKAYVGGEFKPNAGAHAGRDWGKFDITAEVVNRCPGQCIKWDGSKLSIDNKNCVRCMHCIAVMPRALRVGEETGASILLGAKAPILDGQQMSSLIVPFVPAEEPFDEIKEVVEKIWDWWMEEGKNRERVGETMRRMSLQKVLDVIGVEPDARHVKYPRENPYIFWKEEEVGNWDRPIDEYRKRHAR
jgi:sulfite reductase alpha subunit